VLVVRRSHLRGAGGSPLTDAAILASADRPARRVRRGALFSEHSATTESERESPKMHSCDIVYYVHGDGFVLCADHGAELDTEDDASPVSPVFADMSCEGQSVEYCDAGHSFCCVCGADWLADRDQRGPWLYCENCHTEHAYLDGQGYCLADDDRARLTVGWTGTRDRVIPLQYRVPTARLVTTAGIEYLTIDAVLWAGSGDALRVITYGPFGNAVLVEGGTEDAALSERDDWLIERYEADEQSEPWNPDEDDCHPAMVDADPCRIFRIGADERDALAYSGTERTIPRGGVHTTI
jgi:hypothetical protein